MLLIPDFDMIGGVLLNRTVCLAFGSVLTALATAVMFLTGVIPVGTYALSGLAGLTQMIAVMELGSGWAWAVYAASSLLASLLAADKEAVLCYVLIFGCYPIVKSIVERRTKRGSALVLKLLFFNAAAVAEFFLAMYLLHVPQNSYNIFGVNLPWLFLALGNAVFLLYDYAASLLAMQYWRRFHPTVSKWLHSR